VVTRWVYRLRGEVIEVRSGAVIKTIRIDGNLPECPFEVRESGRVDGPPVDYATLETILETYVNPTAPAAPLVPAE
jgi:hypothetical protein